MDLASYPLLWPKLDGSLYTYKPLRKNISTEVAIVGGSIIGALLAYHLSEDGVRVALFERDEIAGGSTSASTALLLYQLDVNLTDLIKKIGREKAVRAYKLSFKSVADIKRIITKLDINCDYTKKKILYVASKKSDVKLLKDEYKMLKKIGLNVEFLNREKLKKQFSLSRHGAIISHDAAEVDPYLLTHELVRHAKRMGARIYTKTEITGYLYKGDRTVLTTKRGVRIHADHAVFATGYESVEYLKEYVVDLKSSYVIASKPMPELKTHWLKDYLLWETSRPYLYVRSTCKSRILVGGEDIETVDATKRDRLIKNKARILKRKFENLVPDLDFKKEYAWAGTFGETEDGLGYIGIPRGFRRIYFALGFGGNGITFGVIAARILQKIIQGKRPKDRALFDFKR